MSVKLIQPIAIELGRKFAIREGSRTVRAGQTTKIINQPQSEAATPARRYSRHSAFHAGRYRQTDEFRCPGSSARITNKKERPPWPS
ncbi:hypothetical protein [Nocardia sp. NPDC051463]|uniref:EF-Tu C-terminal domain-related protein n=1 Tax=Nocardia sp. NPDC051463 TaxID=3154845 RepID=UPI003433B9F2